MKKVFCIAVVFLLCGIMCASICAEGISYTDPLSGIHITLPDGWDKMYFESADASMVSFTGEEDLPSIFFGAVDVYKLERENADLKQVLDRISESRIDYDNGRLSKKILADSFGGSEDDISNLSVGGREYFYFHPKQLDENQDRDAAQCLVRVENGFFYIFTFRGENTHPRYNDFLSMVADAEYPIYSMDEKSVIFQELLIILVSFVLHCLPIVIYRYGIKKEPAENAKEISIVYGIGAVLAGWIAGSYLDVANIGVCALGIVAGAMLNFKFLSK